MVPCALNCSRKVRESQYCPRNVKRNITLALDQEVLKAARALAACQGVSVSALLAEDLRTRVEEERGYQNARRRALDLLERPPSLGGAGANRKSLHDPAELR